MQFLALSPSWQDIQQGQVGFLGDEPDAGVLPERLAQLGAEADRLRMLASDAENPIVAQEQHPGLAGLLFPQLARHIVVGANQFRDDLSIPEGDADRVLAFLTTAGELQVDRIIRVPKGETSLPPLLEMDHRPGRVLVDLLDDHQSRSDGWHLDHVICPLNLPAWTKKVRSAHPSVNLATVRIDGPDSRNARSPQAHAHEQLRPEGTVALGPVVAALATC